MLQEKPVLSVRNLAKIYGSRLIFKNVSLDFYPASVNLVMGANGSGKSSFLRLLAGLAKPTEGDIHWHLDGQPAYLGHQPPAYGRLNALENLAFWAKIHKISFDKNELLNCLRQVDLQNYARETVSCFSRGMMQKLQFARLLLINSPLILLDEPGTGLDQASQRAMREMIRGFRDEGRCVVMVSHDPDNDGALADTLCHFEKHRLHIAKTLGQTGDDPAC